MKAKCLCKAVTIETTHDNQVNACHCNSCRQWGGGANFSLVAKNKPVITGIEHIQHYASSQWGERGFCKHCGTHLYFHLLADDSYFISAGIFADNADFNLSAQIFIDCKAPYYDLANDPPKLTESEFLAMKASQ